jgi:hypothetical protein
MPWLNYLQGSQLIQVTIFVTSSLPRLQTGLPGGRRAKLGNLLLTMNNVDVQCLNVES